MTTYPNMGLVLPTRGAPGAGLWGNTDDANWALVDSHDHSSGKGLPIKTAGISIDADLSFSSLWAVTALKRATFASVAPPAVNKSLFVGDGTGGTTANELYWTSNAGVNVKVTSGSSLNVSAFTGGIGGDYTSVSAAVAYDDAGKRYTFKEGAADSNGWARLACGSVRIIEFGTSESVYVEQLAPAALGASYSVTWPTALPGGATFVKIDNTGQLSFVAAVATVLTYQHAISLALLGDATASLLPNGSSLGTELTLSTSTNEHILPLSIPVGTITGYTVRLNKFSATGTITVKLFEAADLGTPTQIGSTQSNGANNPGNISLTQSGLSFAMTANRQYYLVLKGGGTTGDNATAYSATVST